MVLRKIAIAFAAVGFSSVLLAEERIDTGALGSRGVAWVSPADRTPGIHMLGTAGDIDGDGFDEIALGFLETPYEEGGIPWALFVIYGRPRITGEVPLVPELERSWQVRSTDANTELWASNVSDVAPAGDLDGDGYGDFFISYGIYPHNDPGGGMALLVHGGPDLEGQVVLEDFVATERVTVFRTSDRRYEEVGYQCRLAGDFNGDGEEDIVLSAQGSRLDSAANENQGTVFVVFGARDLPREVDVARIGSDIPGMRLEGFEVEVSGSVNPFRGSGLGADIAPLGDFNGDGLADLAISATGVNPRRVYIVLGERTPPAVLRVADASTHPNVIEMRGSVLRMAGLGDVSGDGLADLAISNAVSEPSFLNPRESWVQVVFGSRAFPGEVAIDDLSGHGVRLDPVQEYASFGGSLATGDFDGDGRTDLAIGSRGADPERRQDAGEAYALYSRDGFAEPSTLKGPYPGLRIVGAEPGDSLGFLGPAGDFDGDGFDDVLVVAGRTRSTRELDEPPRVLRAHLIYGGPDGDAPLDLVLVDSAFGPKEGGTEVTLRGAGFRGAPRVAFGAHVSPDVTVVSGSELRVVTPASDAAGSVDVTVTIDGESASLPGGFEYTDLPEVNLDDLAGRGFVLRESERETSLGQSVAFGDLTGDGVDELIAGGSRAGRLAVSILRGGADLPPALAAFEASPRLTVVTSLDPSLSRAGQVAVVGDVNGDGRGDLLVGAGSGQAFLVFGRETLPEEIVIEDELLFLGAVQLVIDEARGSALRFAATGDLTGDGLDDFALGFVRSASANAQAEGTGELLFVSGRANWPELFDLDAPTRVSSRLRGTTPGPGPGVQWLVTPAGDANGDGLLDLLVTTRSTAAGRVAEPVYLVYGSREFPAEAELDAFVGAGGGAKIELEETSGGTVYARAAGDVNADGFSDILISYEDSAATFENLTLLLAGGAELAASIHLARDPDADDGVLRVFGEGARTVGAYSGNAVTAGDFDFDGYSDFLVGGLTIPKPESFETVFGNVSLILGRAEVPGSPRSIDLRSLGSRGIRIDGHAPSTLRPYSETTGDLNGDGRPDFALVEEHLLLEEGQGPFAPEAGEPIRQDTVYVIYGLPGEPTVGDGSFIRGDSNSDGAVNLADGVFTLTHLFAGGEAPVCEDAADTDDDGGVQLTDAIYLFEHLFAGGPEPPPPFAEAGEDPTEDELGCGAP